MERIHTNCMQNFVNFATSVHTLLGVCSASNALVYTMQPATVVAPAHWEHTRPGITDHNLQRGEPQEHQHRGASLSPSAGNAPRMAHKLLGDPGPTIWKGAAGCFRYAIGGAGSMINFQGCAEALACMFQWQTNRLPRHRSCYQRSTIVTK